MPKNRPDIQSGAADHARKRLLPVRIAPNSNFTARKTRGTVQTDKTLLAK